MTEAIPEQIATIQASRLLDERCLIFKNLLNGVPVWQVARDFHKSSEQDVMNIFNFVIRKIRARRLQRMEPPIVGRTIEELKKYRIALFDILPKLNLDKEPIYKNVMFEEVEVRDDGSVRHLDVLAQMKPIEKHV